MAWWWAIVMLYKNEKARSWKITTGTLLKSEVSGVENDFISVLYEYVVQGQKYTGNRVWVLEGSGSPGEGFTEDWVKRNPIGAKVKVYYNPKNPSECALAKNSPFLAIFILTIGLIFLAVGLFYRE